MIREFRTDDLDSLMEIWLHTNINTHKFIPQAYWVINFDTVKELLQSADLYVYQYKSDIVGFVGIIDGYIAGIFVSCEMQSLGIGKVLLEKCKQNYRHLNLRVYEKNNRAISFYLREGFAIDKKQVDTKTNEIECLMSWNNTNLLKKEST